MKINGHLFWNISFLPEAYREFLSLKKNKGLQKQVLTALLKVAQNPKSRFDEKDPGYGNPLKGPLKGMFKIKYKNITLRLVYSLAIEEEVMNVVVISERDKSKVYDLAEHRKDKYEDDLYKDVFERIELPSWFTDSFSEKN